MAKETLPRGELENITPTAAIRMGDGHGVHSCGDCEVNVPMQFRGIGHWLYAMGTEAFDVVLAIGSFAEQPQFLSLTLQAPDVLHVDHGDRRESVPLEQSEHTSSYLRVCKKKPSAMMVASKTDYYQLLGGLLDDRSKGIWILQGRPERGVVRQ